MRFFDFCAMSGVSLIAGSLFVSVGMNILPAALIALCLWLLGLSMLNYLNHGKLRPFVSRRST